MREFPFQISGVACPIVGMMKDTIDIMKDVPFCKSVFLVVVAELL
jgi:hypothetical protein